LGEQRKVSMKKVKLVIKKEWVHGVFKHPKSVNFVVLEMNPESGGKNP